VIWKENATYGMPVYVGAIFSVATGYLNRMMIPLWVDLRALGFYSIALQFVEPLKLIPGAIATASFREFSDALEISSSTLKRAILLSMAGFLALFLLIGYAVEILLGPEFSEVTMLARLAASGAIIHGYGDLYNRFLGAHGKGQIIRNMTYFVGAINLISFLLLTPLFHIWGAVVSTILGSTAYGVVMWVYYLKATQSLKLAESV
jgi:O-antigen/teichoic acid export membrane protein